MIAEDVAPPVAAALLVGGLHTHICPPDPSLVRVSLLLLSAVSEEPTFAQDLRGQISLHG